MNLFNISILILLALIPVIYKVFFWLYTIQLKEYRLDRYKEYLYTKQGRIAIFNKINYLEFLVLIISLVSFYFLSFFEYTNLFLFYFFIVFLILYNFFILFKIKNKTLLKPKYTSRIIIILLLFILGGSIDLYFLLFRGYGEYIYIYISLVLVFMPIILFFYNFISLPLVNYKKNKLINNAIKKSENINDLIKIGITGSYGKSSVKEYLSSILEQEGNLLKTPNNINTELGVSSVILNKLNNSYDYFIAEMGAYKTNEIEILGKIVNHKYGFLTAIGNQHLGLFGCIENTKKAKFEILKKVTENNGFLYVNNDNKFIREYLETINTNNIIRYGIDSENSCAKSYNINIKDGYTNFDFSYNGYIQKFKTNLIGKHNVLNLTGILAFCIDRGIEIKKLEKYLLDLTGPDNTLNIIKKGDLILINDSYNLSEAGLFAGLDVLNSFDLDKILIIDDILELGEEADKIHKNIGAKIAKEYNISKIIFCGINYRKPFIEGLITEGFKKDNIILNLDNIKEKKSILFEGRNSKKYFDKINN